MKREDFIGQFKVGDLIISRSGYIGLFFGRSADMFGVLWFDHYNVQWYWWESMRTYRYSESCHMMGKLVLYRKIRTVGIIMGVELTYVAVYWSDGVCSFYGHEDFDDAIHFGDLNIV